jgi:hypothetical protein
MADLSFDLLKQIMLAGQLRLREKRSVIIRRRLLT